MKIRVPVNSVESARIFAKMGIEEAYVGVGGIKEHGNRIVNFNGRFNNARKCSIESYDDLREIVKICHDSNIEVSFVANSRYLSENLHDYYLEYVDRALECGVDAIIVGSIGGLMLLKDKLEVPICSSTFFYPYNKHCIDFYHSMNVKRVVLPTAITLKEIQDIVSYTESKKYDMEIEVFAQFGCSNVSGRCNVCGHTQDKAYLMMCRGLYDVTDMSSGDKAEMYPFLNAPNNCSICNLDALMKCGVTCLKFLGREQNVESIAHMVGIFKTAMEQLKSGDTPEEVKANIVKQNPWWEYVFCNYHQCLYKETGNSPYNV